MQIAARTGSTGLLALLALVTLLASIPGQSADPGPDPGRADELRVEFMLPSGPAHDVPTVDVLFSRPMRALGTETRGDENSLLRLDPPVPGRFMWIGSRALRFVPDRPFPRATSFRATVPQGIADAAGKTLAAPVTWTFSTPAPALTAIRPAPHSRHLAPGGPIFLAFDQPVDLERVRTAVTLAAGRAAVATTCTHPDSAALAALATPLPAASRDAIVLLRPQSPLPRASAVTLTIAARPLAAEGPLPFAADSIVSFTTYGPLALVAGEADADGLTLELSNPVDPDSLCARLRLFGPAVADSARPVAHGRAAASRIPLGVRLAPGRPFRVQVLAGLRDTFGQTLAAPATLDLVTQDLDPMLEIRPDHAVLEARADRRTAIVRTTNVERVIVRTALLSAAQAAFLARRPWAMTSGEIDPFAGLRPRERAHRVVADRNRPGRIAVDLGELIPPPGGGFVLLRASAPGCFLGSTGAPADTLPARYSLVQITDLGLMAKVSATDILVWATSLHTGEPLARVDLEIVDEAGAVRWRGRTGEDGLARDRTPAPWERAAGWTLIARRGRDQTILGIDTDWELSPWSFDLPGDYASAPVRADAFLFSDRELYRPGETVRVKAIVRGRDRNGLGPAPLDSVQLKVMGPYGAAVSEQALRLSAFGTTSVEIPLGNAAPLGYYWATLEPLGADPDLVDLRGSLGFRVEAFRAAAFKADLALAGPRGPAAAGPAAPLVLVRGDSLVAALTARTFFDAPLAGAPVTFVLRRARADFAPPPAAAAALAGYSFTDPSVIETDWELVTTARAVVDSRGQARMAARLDLPAVSAPQTIEVEAQALDQGGRAVAANGLAAWYPADLVLGVRAEPGLVAAGRPLHVAAVAVTPEGAPVAGTAVRIEWIERTWHTVMRQMVGGRLGYDSELVETVLDSAVVTTSGDLAAPAGARFVPPRPGSYTARARAADARGRSVRAADFAHAGGPGFVPWSRESGNRLVLVADRAAYSPGDTATILIESPFPRAAGLLTVEREGIREVIPFTATSAAPTVRVPLGESAVPNVFASVALVRGSAPPVTAPDDTLRSPTPEFRLGYILLPVKPDGRKLAVRVTSPERAGPGDSVRVTIDVTRAREGVAADAEVTLLLVDEAVLRLTGTPTPDPFAYFYRTQGLGVLNAAKTLQVVAAPEAEEKGLFPGGGGGDSGRFRRLFAATAVYLPALATGPDGRVEARFRLPDNLTTFRAMAIACDRKDRVGHGEAALTVTRPLVLDPVLPRLARVGDTFAAAAVVTNRTDKKLKVHVDFRATGDAVETTGKTERTVTLEAGRNRRVSFPLRARAAGTATIEMVARAAGKQHGAAAPRDAVSFPFRVEEPLLQTVAADYGVLAGADSLALVPISVPAAADPAQSSLAIQVSTSLLGGIEPALQYLLEYPHGCLEQIDSRLIALAVARELAPRLILSGWDEKRQAGSAERTLAELAALSHYDGGYRVWPDAGRSDPYLSAYTLAALLEARDAGIRIDAARLTELARHLKERFDAKRPAPPPADEPAPKSGRRARPPRPSAPAAPPALSSSGPPFDAADALLATLLARERRNAGSPLRDLLGPGDVERLAVHERDLDREGHLLLAAALDLSHPYDARVGQIMGPILDDVAMTGGRAFLPAGDMRYANDEMTTALALRVLLAAWPDHPLVVPMGRWLATERRNGTWRTTHATAQAVLALRDLARLEGDPAGPILARAALPAAPLFSEQLGGRAPTALRLTWSLAGRTALAPGGNTTLTLARAMPAGVGPEARGGAPALYHTVQLTTARPALALAAAEDGLILERRAYPFDPIAPRAAVEPGATARTGDVVRLEITLVAPRAVTDVAIEDPLPAGLEPLLLDLETVARSLGRGLDERAGRGGYGGFDGYDGYGEYGGERAELDYVATGGVFPAIRVERRDDRVAAFATALPAGIYRFEYLARAATPGTFAAPPATVELMYDPEVNARTGPLRFTVTETPDRENR